MTARIPLVIISGNVTELPAGDSLPPSVAISPGLPGQLLQTNAGGTQVEWTSDIALSGSLAIGVISSGVWQGSPIVDTKLATITTAGKVANSATTAVSTNTANAIVARDASGNFNAGTITASLNGNASTATSATTAGALSSTRTFALTGDVTGSVNSDLTSGASIATSIAAGSIVNADVNASAAIADTKLATISTAGKVSNSATTATNINTPDTIVARDGSGNFSAEIVTVSGLTASVINATIINATVSGVADTATRLSSARTFALTGDVTGSVNSDLTSGASIATSIAAGSIINADINASAAIADTKLATISTAGKVSNSATTATNTNTASAIVSRDASGNFEANLVTVSGLTAVSGTPLLLGTNDVERVRVSAVGNVGIGTLDMGGAGSRLDVATSGTGSNAIRSRNSVASVFLEANNGYTYLNTTTDTPFLIGTNNVERIRVTSSGNVGINTTAAPYTLSVGGSVYVGTSGTFVFEGATPFGFQTVLTAADPTGARTLTLPDTTGTIVTTGDSGSVTSTMIANGTIVDGDINASAAIADTKLATISTAGKVSNSATTATNANTANAIVARDASGNFSAGTITASLNGNANTATSATSATSATTATTAGALSSARTFALTGDVTGSVSSDLTSGASIATSIAAGSIVDADINASAAIADTKLATISTAGKISNSATTATNLNTANAIVARDASGNFTAGTITASLNGNASTATSATSATTAGSCTGNSATATKLSSSRTFELTGDVTGSVASDLASGATISTAIAAGSIVNADINASAAIVDTKLATISTAGKVSNSATTATNANTANAIVARDASGNFSAGTITASLNGNASTATSATSATTAGSCTGNSATATTAVNLSTIRTNWSSNGTITAVVGQLGWKNYGNNHTIFDASASTSPDATSVNNTDAQVAWTSTYPTLMGWNGASTYGVRVDSSRTSDRLSSARTFALTGDVTGSVSSDLISGASISTAIAANSIVNADVNVSAAIAGTKIDPNFGSQTVGTTGNIGAGTVGPGTRFDAYVSGSGSSIIRTRNDSVSVYLDANNGYSYLNTITNHPFYIGTNNSIRLNVAANGQISNTVNTSGLVSAFGVLNTDTSNSLTSSLAGISICNDNSVGFGKTGVLTFCQGAFTNVLASIAAVYTDYSSSVGGALVFSTNNGSSSVAEKARLTSDGKFLVGAIASPAYQLQVSTDSAGKPGTNTWTIVSDERIKDDIELADLDLCYEAVKNIPLKRFKWKDEVYTDEQVPDRHKLGWIAQDVERVFPKAVRSHEFKYGQVFEEVILPAVEEELDEEGNVVTPYQPEQIINGELLDEKVIPDCLDLNADQIYAVLYGTVQKLIQKIEILENKVLYSV